jgi:hypothetical protein
MAHPRRDSKTCCNVSRAAYAALLISFLCVFTLSTVTAYSEERYPSLEESGIRYPEGFDMNTVGEVQGKASGFFRPGQGPVRFTLSSERESYIVIASPEWYWNDMGLKISEGERVIVTGSKSLGKDGNLYIIAQEIKVPATRQSYSFRGDDGRPLWRGAGLHGTGGHRGFGSPSGRGGGGNGMGGMGRGRR